MIFISGAVGAVLVILGSCLDWLTVTTRLGAGPSVPLQWVVGLHYAQYGRSTLGYGVVTLALGVIALVSTTFARAGRAHTLGAYTVALPAGLGSVGISIAVWVTLRGHHRIGSPVHWQADAGVFVVLAGGCLLALAAVGRMLLRNNANR
jgi:hypothetical protein